MGFLGRAQGRDQASGAPQGGTVACYYDHHLASHEAGQSVSVTTRHRLQRPDVAGVTDYIDLLCSKGAAIGGGGWGGVDLQAPISEQNFDEVSRPGISGCSDGGQGQPPGRDYDSRHMLPRS